MTAKHFKSWQEHPDDTYSRETSKIVMAKFTDAHSRAVKYLVLEIGLDGEAAIKEINFLGYQECEALIELYSKNLRGYHLRTIRLDLGSFYSVHKEYLTSLILVENKNVYEAIAQMTVHFGKSRGKNLHYPTSYSAPLATAPFHLLVDLDQTLVHTILAPFDEFSFSPRYSTSNLNNFCKMFKMFNVVFFQNLTLPSPMLFLCPSKKPKIPYRINPKLIDWTEEPKDRIKPELIDWIEEPKVDKIRPSITQ